VSHVSIHNARIVLEDQVVIGSVIVRDGIICEIGEGEVNARSEAGSLSINANGDYLIPGLVEIHTDALEWHLRPRPQSNWPAKAAVVAHDAMLATSAITTVLDSLCIGDLGSDGFRSDVLGDALKAIDETKELGALRVDHYIHLRCEVADPRTPALFDQEIERDSVRLVSLMDHTPGIRQYRDVDAYRNSLTTSPNTRIGNSSLGGSTSTIESANDQIALLQARRAEHSMPNWRYIASCATAHDVALASHDDASAADISLAVSSGVAIAEFPTTTEAAAAAHANGLVTVAGAPNVVRGGSHSGNVSAAALATEGLLDILSSDYVPYSLLHAPFILHKQGIVSLPKAISMVTSGPARAVGFTDRGTIRVGSRADMALIKLSDWIPTVSAVWSNGKRIS
jgi:alpha-D-ribose 1-methylphosphonate 5-triphosphate diphosphatase